MASKLALMALALAASGQGFRSPNFGPEWDQSHPNVSIHIKSKKVKPKPSKQKKRKRKTSNKQKRGKKR